MAKHKKYFKGKQKNGYLLDMCRPSTCSAFNLSKHGNQPGSSLPSLPLNMPQSPATATFLLPEKTHQSTGSWPAVASGRIVKNVFGLSLSGF